MYKVILIETHGFSVTEGTQIHCHAAFNKAAVGEFMAVFLLDEHGRTKMSRIDTTHYKDVPGHPFHAIFTV